MACDHDSDKPGFKHVETQNSKFVQATNIKFVDGSSSQQMFSGVVRTFNEQKGWGFIESPEAKQVFNSDVFFHQKELTGIAVKVGDTLQFSVDVSSGKASATNISAGFGAVPTSAANFRSGPY